MVRGKVPVRQRLPCRRVRLQVEGLVLTRAPPDAAGGAAVGNAAAGDA